MLYIKEQTSVNTIWGTTIDRPEYVLSKSDNMNDATIILDRWVSDMAELLKELDPNAHSHGTTVEYDASYGHVTTKYYITD